MRAHRLLADGLIGDIQHVLCHMASPTRGLFAGDPADIMRLWDSQTGSKPDIATWQSPARGGGYAHGQITHSSALLFFLTGLRAATVAGRVSLGGAAVDLFDAGVITFEGGALGALSGAATLPDGEPYQVDIRLFGTEGVLMLDTERERMWVHRYDGDRQELTIERGAGDYECVVPPNRFIDLITGASDQNNSDARVAARSVELIEALLRSSMDDGRTVAISPSPAQYPAQCPAQSRTQSPIQNPEDIP